MTNNIFDAVIIFDRLVKKKYAILEEIETTRKEMNAVSSAISTKSYDDNEEKYQLEDVLVNLRKRNDMLMEIYKKTEERIAHMRTRNSAGI